MLQYDKPPTLEELEVAFSQVKTRKAGGLSGTVPELICLEFLFWSEGRVVNVWRDTLIVPAPNKVNSQSCDHWRGISLLDVVGKFLQELSVCR